MRTKKAKRYDEQIKREIEKATMRFPQQFMSNAKWVRLIARLVENVDTIKKTEFKKVQNDQIGELFLSADTAFGFDYWRDGFEGHNSLGGVLVFKEIEYLIFPRIIDVDNNVTQDLDQIKKIINSLGQFALDENEVMLKLLCYQE